MKRIPALSPRLWAVFLILSTLLAGIALGFRRTALRQQELRVLICARNMVRDGDWLVPKFQDQIRLRKPPLAYWMAAVPMALGTSENSPVGARLPFLLCACAILILLMAWGRQMVDNSCGWLAMAIPILTAGWWRYLAIAETDIPSAFFAALAAWSFWRMSTEKPSVGYWLLAGTATGLGFLTKGPGILLPWIAVGIYLLLSPRMEREEGIFRWQKVLPGLLLALGLASSWYLCLWCVRGISPAFLSQLTADLPATFTHRTEHPGSWIYYLYTLPKLLLPIGLLLPWVLWKMGREFRRDRNIRFLFCWLGVAFALLTLISSKQEHYALQMLIPAVLLTAKALHAVSCKIRRSILVLSTMGSVGFAVWGWAGLPISRFEELPSFLQSCRTKTDSAVLVHVCGVNSAIFDYYLGRHVHNVDQPMDAWRRARSGEAIVLADRPKIFNAWAPIPLAPLKIGESDDMKAALYVKP